MIFRYNYLQCIKIKKKLNNKIFQTRLYEIVTISKLTLTYKLILVFYNFQQLQFKLIIVVTAIISNKICRCDVFSFSVEHIWYTNKNYIRINYIIIEEYSSVVKYASRLSVWTKHAPSSKIFYRDELKKVAFKCLYSELEVSFCDFFNLNLRDEKIKSCQNLITRQDFTFLS